MDLSGKHAIVTGGSNGIGRAIAEHLAGLDVKVVVLDIEAPPGEAAHFGFVSVDLADWDRTREAVATAVDQVQGVDFLVNCAASFIAAGLSGTAEQWRRSLSVNVSAIANTVASVQPSMAARGGGSIVNVASISATIAQPARWTYNASKGAVLALTRCQALDLSSYGIRVNSVSPGWVWTREVEKAAHGDLERAGAEWGEYAMLSRLGQPDEIASAVCFLLSDDASFITGAELRADGGYLSLGPEGRGATADYAGSE